MSELTNYIIKSQIISDHRLRKRVNVSGVAAASHAALLVEEARREVHLAPADAQHRDQLQEAHPALVACSRVSH